MTKITEHGQVLLELGKIQHVRLRTGSRQTTSVQLHGFHGVRGMVSVKARLRTTESVEAMLWRALAEYQKRVIEGMPKPHPHARARRRQMKLLHTANTRPM